MRRSRRSSASCSTCCFCPGIEGDRRGAGGAGRVGAGARDAPGRGRLLNPRWRPSINAPHGRSGERFPMDRGASEDVPVLIVAAAWSACRPRCPALARNRRAGGRTARGHRDQRPGRRLPPPHGGDPALGRAGGRRPAQVGGAVPAGRRDQQRRVAGGPGDRELLPEPQRRGRGVQPDGAAIHQPGRARADPAHPGHRARRSAAVPHRVHVAGAGRGPASRRSSAIWRAGRRVRCGRSTSSRPTETAARSANGSASACTATACCRTASPSTSGRWPISGRCSKAETRASTT